MIQAAEKEVASLFLCAETDLPNFGVFSMLGGYKSEHEVIYWRLSSQSACHGGR